MKEIHLKFKVVKEIDGVFKVPDEMYDLLSAFNHYDLTEHRAIEKFDDKSIAGKLNKFLTTDLYKNYRHFSTKINFKEIEINNEPDNFINYVD